MISLQSTSEQNRWTSRRFAGVELFGAKNPKTVVAVLEYFPKEKKIFLIDLLEGIGASKEATGDEALISKLREIGPRLVRVAVSAPLEMPACMVCTRKHCPMPRACTVSNVQWMREFMKSVKPAKEWTPYTQRPVELWLKHRVVAKLPLKSRFDIDEAFGGSQAALAARMHFLKWHIDAELLIEVWPKLTLARIAKRLRLSDRLISKVRSLEEGFEAREKILTQLAEVDRIFLYEKDRRRLAQSVAAFDAFLCAYTAWLDTLELCVPRPEGFSSSAQWVSFPI